MADIQLFTNNAVSLLATPITAAATSLTVMTGYGAQFPQPATATEYFLVTLEDQAAATREIIRVNGRSGDTFTGLVRGYEGTTPLPWAAALGNDTLVDHRVTAGTMRLAMQLPVAGPASGSGGISGIAVQSAGVSAGVAATTLNFTGAVTVVDNGVTKEIQIGAGSQQIPGVNTPLPNTIPSAITGDLSNIGYDTNQRGFKFFVTITAPSQGFLSSTFEVLGNISGDLATNSETSSFNRSARVGYNFLGVVNIALDTATKTMDFVWTNQELFPVEVMCVRIQMKP